MGSRAGRRNYPWRTMVAALRSRPGRWRLFSEMTAVPYSLIERIRGNEIRALILNDGKIYARKGHQGWRDDGAPVIDIWLKYAPKENHASTQAQSEPEHQLDVDPG